MALLAICFGVSSAQNVAGPFLVIEWVDFESVRYRVVTSVTVLELKCAHELSPVGIRVTGLALPGRADIFSGFGGRIFRVTGGTGDCAMGTGEGVDPRMSFVTETCWYKTVAFVTVQALRVFFGELTLVDVFVAALTRIFNAQVTGSRRVGILVVKGKLELVALSARHGVMRVSESKAREGVDFYSDPIDSVRPDRRQSGMALFTVLRKRGAVGRFVTLCAFRALNSVERKELDDVSVRGHGKDMAATAFDVFVSAVQRKEVRVAEIGSRPERVLPVTGITRARKPSGVRVFMT